MTQVADEVFAVHCAWKETEAAAAGSGDDKSWKADLLSDHLRGRSIQTGGDRTNHLQMTLFSP